MVTDRKNKRKITIDRIPLKMPIDVDGRIWYNNTEKMKIEDLEANTVMLERSVDHTRENVNIG